MKYVIIAILAISIISGCTGTNTSPEPKVEQPQVIPTAQPTEPVIAQGPCDASLWYHVYHPYRLKVIDECKTVTGTIKNFVQEADGDFHVRLDVDDKSLINQANVKGQHGYLLLEPICQNAPTQEDADQPCQTYSGPYFNISHYVGKHVKVTGSYVSDLDHDGWMEIHPISSIEEG